jgi:hypothetical protein
MVTKQEKMHLFMNNVFFCERTASDCNLFYGDKAAYSVLKLLTGFAIAALMD